MVAIRRVSSTVAACMLFFVFPSLASAHLLAVSVEPSQCVSPLNGQYRATITITETYFGGTIEDIPVGQNVHELTTSTDRSNTGLNQNYFTQGVVGTQTGPAGLGQPTVFTSPASGGAATQQFTVTTSVPETYVLANSYMRSPATGTINPPRGGCTPPAAPKVSVTAASVCTTPLDGTYRATIEIISDQAFDVPAGTTSGSQGVNFLSPQVASAPTRVNAGDTAFTLTGLTQPIAYVIGAPGGNIASAVVNPPATGCQSPPPQTPPPPQTQTPPPPPPPPRPPSCAPGQTLAGSQCVTVTRACAVGQRSSGGRCVPAACHVAARSSYRVRAGEWGTIVVSVRAKGTPVAGATLRITLPGGKTITRVATSGGTVTFTVKPKKRGAISIRTGTCTGSARVKVFAPKVPTSHHPPSFTG